MDIASENVRILQHISGISKDFIFLFVDRYFSSCRKNNIIGAKYAAIGTNAIFLASFQHKMVGAERFELSTFCSQGRRASQAALYPD